MSEEEGLGNEEGSSEGNGESGDSNTWPDTWREDWAGDNEKMSEHLSRYASPSAALTAGYSANLKRSSGEYKSSSPFPEKGSDEEKSTWGTNAGIPEEFNKYEIGRDVEDSDKAVIDRFLEFAHERHATPDSVKTAVEWFYHDRDIMAEEGSESDSRIATESEDSLRAEWGEEYRANVNRIDGFLDTGGVKEKLLNARLEDGTLLKSSPDVLKFLIDVALQINPATTLVPGAGDNVLGAIGDEMDALKKLMGNKSSDYWQGPKAEKNQARYKELLEAQLKLKK